MSAPPLRISIVVPAHDSAQTLPECLTALQAFASPGAEIIVVDDASTDGTAAVASRMGARVLRLDRNSGPAAARNHGARHARGDVLLFVDADVVLSQTAVGRVAEVLERRPEVAAVFGSYDTRPRAGGLVSQYRNLLHHFVHQHGAPDASTFWAGIGAIRRKVFDASGGFDPARFPMPSIEDIELGFRLRRAGHRILLDKAIQGTHLKRWTLWSVIRTDIFSRAVPWSRLTIETGELPDDLNLKWNQRVSGGLVGLASLLALLAPLRVELLALAAVAALATVGLNRELFAFFVRERGFLFAVACVPLHLLYYLYSGASYVCVRANARLRGRVSRAVPWGRGERDTGRPERTEP